MKKIEIISKNGKKKKSHIIKIKSMTDLQHIASLLNYLNVKKTILPDIDLTTDTTFKVDGEKVSIAELKANIRNQEKEFLSSSGKKKKKKNKISSDKKADKKKKPIKTGKKKKNDSEITYDKSGRIVIKSIKARARKAAFEEAAKKSMSKKRKLKNKKIKLSKKKNKKKRK